jgi:DNA polymerase III sliding clamp (beta) subunit (PCNA family)
MSRLLDLAEFQDEDPEVVPQILPVDARLSAAGPVESFKKLFERAASVTPEKEVISGTGFALLTSVGAARGSLPYLRIAATDGELSIEVNVDGFEVRLAGAALVPPKKILKILNLVPGPRIALDVLGNSLIMRSGRAQWTVQLPVGDALPPTPDVSMISLDAVDTRELIAGLSGALRAASHHTARSALMQLHLENGTVTGLDGARLHQCAVPSLSMLLETTIPNTAATEALALLRRGVEQSTHLGANGSHVVFQIGQDTLIAQKLLLPFPKDLSLIHGPAMTNQHRLTVERQELIEAVKRVRLNADPDFMVIMLSLIPGRVAVDGTSWELKVSARDKLGNNAIEILPVTWSGPTGSRVLYIQHHQLIDMLEVASSDEMVTLRLGDDTGTNRLPLFIDTGDFVGWVQQISPGFLG